MIFSRTYVHHFLIPLGLDLSKNNLEFYHGSLILVRNLLLHNQICILVLGGIFLALVSVLGICLSVSCWLECIKGCYWKGSWHAVDSRYICVW